MSASREAGKGGLVIRLAEAADAEAIGVLDREWTPIRDRAARFHRAASEARLLVAAINGQLVGYAALGSFFGYGFLELLAVRPDRRRQRIATALIEAVESRCGTTTLFTSTNQSNRPMRRLCKRLGFRPSGRIEDLDDGDPELFYVKRLG
jgi:GNAT superfamily N-acetyltransferase